MTYGGHRYLGEAITTRVEETITTSRKDALLPEEIKASPILGSCGL